MMKDKDKNNSPLGNIDKTNKFNVPEGYFESFSSRLSEKIENDRFSIKPAFNFRLAYAAAFIGFILIVFSGISYLHQNNMSSEIEDAITYNINEYEDDQLFEAYSESLEKNLPDDDSEHRENLDAMVNYLLYSDTDINSIINEL